MNPIFIVGMNGSGTTMLADCLNQHPQIYIHKIESRVIPFYYFNLEKYGNLEDEKNFRKILTDFSDNSAFRICNENRKPDIPFDFNKLDQKNLAGAIDITFSYFAKKENKAIWGDHSPKYGFFIPVLTDLFPGAKIIHIFRDGRDCALSFKRRFAYNIYRSIYNWKKLAQKTRHDGLVAGTKRYFEIKYEDLTQEPEIWMKKICAFLEVSYDSRVLYSNMPMFAGKEKELKTIVKNTGKWRTRFTKKQINRLEMIAGKTLEDLGYEVLYPGDDEMPPLTLFILKWTDRVNTTISYYKRYDGEDKLERFIKYVSTSLKQSKIYKY